VAGVFSITSVAQIWNKFPVFYGTCRFINVFTSAIRKWDSLPSYVAEIISPFINFFSDDKSVNSLNLNMY